MFMFVVSNIRYRISAVLFEFFIFNRMRLYQYCQHGKLLSLSSLLFGLDAYLNRYPFRSYTLFGFHDVSWVQSCDNNKLTTWLLQITKSLFIWRPNIDLCLYVEQTSTPITVKLLFKSLIRGAYPHFATTWVQ